MPYLLFSIRVLLSNFKTNVEPREVTASPEFVALLAIKAAILSVVPAQTKQLADNCNLFAIAEVILPMGFPGGNTSGKSELTDNFFNQLGYTKFSISYPNFRAL